MIRGWSTLGPIGDDLQWYEPAPEFPYVEVEYKPCGHRAVWWLPDYETFEPALVCGDCLSPVLEVFDA